MSIKELEAMVDKLPSSLTDMVVDRDGVDIVYVGEHGSRFSGVGLLNTGAVAVQDVFMVAGVEAKPHTHSCKEIGIIYSGVMEVNVRGETHRLNRGDYIVFEANEVHSAVAVEDCRSVWTTIPASRSYPNDDR